MWFVLSWFSGTGNGMVWHEATPMCLATTAGTTWWCQRFEGQFLWNLVNRFDSYMDSRPLKWIIIIQNEQIHGQTRVPWDVYMYYINNMIPMINMVLRRNLAMAMTQVPTQLFLSLSLSLACTCSTLEGCHLARCQTVVGWTNHCPWLPQLQHQLLSLRVAKLQEGLGEFHDIQVTITSQATAKHLVPSTRVQLEFALSVY